MPSTLVLLKPDAVARGLTFEISERFEKRGLPLVACKMLQPTREQAAAHYKPLEKTADYAALVDFLVSGPAVVMVWGAEPAAVSALAGDADPAKAALGSIRGDLAVDKARNLLECSASAEEARRERMAPFLALGASAGIAFDLEVGAQYQPVESQRLLLWAGRFGRQEEYMSALNRRHFERRESASLRATVLAAAAEAELDVAAAEAFLDTDELEADVWRRSYGETIRGAGIRAIPLFALSLPSIGAEGGPFRPAGAYEAYVVRGSADTAHFRALFELIARDAAAGAREYDAAAFPYRRDEWWASASAQKRLAG